MIEKQSTKTPANTNSIISNSTISSSSCVGPGNSYGLRPREILRRPLLTADISGNEIGIGRRSRVRYRGQPLSKYRRKTANARERHRMKEINDAFASLRCVLPVSQRCTTSSSMTKITTLKLAVHYIQALADILTVHDKNNYYNTNEINGNQKECFENYRSFPKSNVTNDSISYSCYSQMSESTCSKNSFPERNLSSSSLVKDNQNSWRDSEDIKVSTSSEKTESILTSSDIYFPKTDLEDQQTSDNLDDFCDITSLSECDSLSLFLSNETQGILMTV